MCVCACERECECACERASERVCVRACLCVYTTSSLSVFMCEDKHIKKSIHIHYVTDMDKKKCWLITE